MIGMGKISPVLFKIYDIYSSNAAISITIKYIWYLCEFEEKKNMGKITIL